MKEKYITPEMDIILFECEDVITTSGIAENASINALQMLNASYIGTIDDNQWTQS
jgi:hypothetical protein